MAKGKYQEWLSDDGLLRIEGWAREGLNDEQLAGKIGIRPSTFYEWQNRFPEFSEALKRGKAPVDFEVENALLKKARGFTVTVKKAIKVRTKRQLKDKVTIEEEHIEYVDEEVYIPPDTTAQIFWLKNRKPEKWRDKPEYVENAETLKRAGEILGGIESAID